jgi:hypothetical protein
MNASSLMNDDLGYELEDDEIGGACSMNGRDGKSMQNFSPTT